MSILNRILSVAAATLSFLMMTACGVIPGTQAPLEHWATYEDRVEASKKQAAAELAAPAAPVPAAEVPVVNNDDYYEAHVDGRIYVFDDQSTWLSFIATGEAPYRLARIGGGPDGKTLVFGLSEADKTRSSDIAGMDMYDGKLAGADSGFYGEIIFEERFYVFSNWADMQSFRQTHDAALRFTEIGTGPGGRTVNFVLNDATKSERPDTLRARFYAIHSG